MGTLKRKFCIFFVLQYFCILNFKIRLYKWNPRFLNSFSTPFLADFFFFIGLLFMYQCIHFRFYIYEFLKFSQILYTLLCTLTSYTMYVQFCYPAFYPTYMYPISTLISKNPKVHPIQYPTVYLIVYPLEYSNMYYKLYRYIPFTPIYTLTKFW